MKVFITTSIDGKQRKLIGEGKTNKSCVVVMKEFLKYKNVLDPPYWRFWTEENGETWYDFGYHNTFFIVSK